MESILRILLISMKISLLLGAGTAATNEREHLNTHHERIRGNRREPLDAAINQTTVFSAGEYGFACFRIPVLLAPRPDLLLAFVEARYHSCSDYSCRSILVKRSTDGGTTWGEPVVVANITRPETLKLGDGLNLGTAVFVPAPSAASATTPDRVWVTWTECYHRCTVPLQYIAHSDDLGETWPDSNKANITSEIMPASKFAPGPGYGLVLSSTHRILMCGHYIKATSDGMDIAWGRSNRKRKQKKIDTQFETHTHKKKKKKKKKNSVGIMATFQFF